MYKKYIKVILDFVLALMLMPLVLIIIAICGIFIKLEDNGPIFYLGDRLGKDKKIFEMYKLRSMNVNAPDIRNDDGSTFNSNDDFRLTRVGKFIRKASIDEIPQIINVLIGKMSFIGPRPDLPEAINYYTENQSRRLEVKPGITGYSQAYYRNSINTDSKYENDIFYIENLSFIFDCKILLRTIKVVLQRKNIFIDDDKI